jgi:hypothetical protein
MLLKRIRLWSSIRGTHKFNKYYEDGVVHVSSVNDATNEKVVLRLTESVPS